jgi:hypothetical protein
MKRRTGSGAVTSAKVSVEDRVGPAAEACADNERRMSPACCKEYG